MHFPDDADHNSIDTVSAEPISKPIPSQTAGNVGAPGAIVCALCFAIDFLLMFLASRFDPLWSSMLGKAIGSVIPGILVAQLAMLGIWLGMMATALYWMLVGVALLVVAVLALIPGHIHWPSLFGTAWGALMFTLPFALVRLAGFRLDQSAHMPEYDRSQERVRFPLSRLFAWTFIIAALLGLYHWIPAGTGSRFELYVELLTTSLIAISTVWAVLLPGPIQRWLTAVPVVLLASALLLFQKIFGWSVPATIEVACSGLFFVVTLAGLLAVYRKSGMRLAATSGRGWLVR